MSRCLYKLNVFVENLEETFTNFYRNWLILCLDVVKKFYETKDGKLDTNTVTVMFTVTVTVKPLMSLFLDQIFLV